MKNKYTEKVSLIHKLVYLLSKCTHKATPQNNYAIVSVNYYNCPESNLYDPKSNIMKQSNLAPYNASIPFCNGSKLAGTGFPSLNKYPSKRHVVSFLQPVFLSDRKISIYQQLKSKPGLH